MSSMIIATRGFFSISASGIATRGFFSVSALGIAIRGFFSDSTLGSASVLISGAMTTGSLLGTAGTGFWVLIKGVVLWTVVRDSGLGGVTVPGPRKTK